MRAAICLFFSVFFLNVIHGQDLILTPIGETVCSPGVVNKSPGKGLLIEYGLRPGIKLQSNSSNIDEPSRIGLNKRYKIKLKAPLVNKEKLKVLVGWNYYGEEYNFNHIGYDDQSLLRAIDNRGLKSSRLSLYLIKPINYKYYFALKAVAAYNGDYDGIFNFDSRYARYDVATIFGVKKRANVEWGVGLLFRKGFTNSFPVVPFGIYNHTFNSKWGIEATIPTSIKGRYNINDKSLITFGPSFESRSYSIDVNGRGTNSTMYTMQRSELKFGLSYQHNIKGWLWMEASSGYVRNFDTRFEVNNNSFIERKVTSLNPSNGTYFKFGIFLSPPRNKFK